MAVNKERIKELAKPIAEGLFGKQKPYQLQKEDVIIRPVGMIVEDLAALSDDDWALYAFSREPLRGKFDTKQKHELTHLAYMCGIEYAGKLTGEYGGVDDPEVLSRMLGVSVDYPVMPQAADRVLFAEFREPDQIHIYTDGVDKGRILLTEPGVREALGDDFSISKLLLGHELFHFVEEKYKKEIWTRTYRFDLWKIGPITNRSGVSVLSEIAAMAFTKALNHLRFSPYVMDAYLVYGYSPEAASSLYEEMMLFAGLEPRLPGDVDDGDG